MRNNASTAGVGPRQVDDGREMAGLYELMDRYGDGDPRAFEGLHDALSPRLRGFLMKLVRDETTVDDLLQLTFLKAHLARDRFRVQGDDPDGSVQGWYFAIARNVALDHLRQSGRRARRQTDLERDGRRADFVHDRAGAGAGAGAGANIEQEITEHERADEIVRQVREAIAALPEGQREVVELHKLRGLSMAEVASRLQIREGAARVRAHRGYKALARILGASSLGLLALQIGPPDRSLDLHFFNQHLDQHLDQPLDQPRQPLGSADVALLQRVAQRMRA